MILRRQSFSFEHLSHCAGVCGRLGGLPLTTVNPISNVERATLIDVEESSVE
jgi:hypothetical protein